MTTVGRALGAVLAALAGRPGGMLVKEMREVLAGELRGQLRLAVQRGIRDGLIEYDPERDGRNNARAYRLTPAGREAASRPGEPALAPQPRKAAVRLAPGRRAYAILSLLEGSGDGMTCREIIIASGGTPDASAQNTCNVALRAALGLGYVTRHWELRADAHGRGREIWVWQITRDGAAARARASSPPAPAPARAPRAEYAWAAGAAGRHEKGESVYSIAVSLGLSDVTVKRALEARGVTIVPYSHVQPPWAAQAAGRYEAGESCPALARAYDVPANRMGTILKRAGVTLRDRKAAAMLRQAARGRPGPEPAEPAGPARADSTALARAALPSPGTEGEATVTSPDARSPQFSFRQ